MYVSYDNNNIILAVSESPFNSLGHRVVKMDLPDGTTPHKLIGTKLKTERRERRKLRVALICNWGDQCGIATYTNYLVEALRPKVGEVKIFSEITPAELPDGPDVIRCWRRGQSHRELLEKLTEYAPDFVIVQHEYGIFPKATYFLQLLQGLDQYPYVIVMHSTYEHLDKAVCSSACKNIIVHSQEAQDCLVRIGNNNHIFVVPHGCVSFPAENTAELWNIFHTPFALMQFGFGFFYKGVDRVLEAMAVLKAEQPDKYQEIFYAYLCSENKHTNVVHTQYYSHLLRRVDELGLFDNVAIIRKYQTDKTLNSYLRTAKVALFPYSQDPKNVVYGASGAIRVAMANRCPVIASGSHMFDDLEGVVPRPTDETALAQEIDEVFSNTQYRNSLLARQDQYVADNSWATTADRYLAVYDKLA